MRFFSFSPAKFCLLVTFLLALSAALTYYVGMYSLRASVQKLEIINVRQNEQVEELMRRNEALMTGRAMMERRLEVSNQTREYLRDMLQVSEIESRKIRGELELFRQITALSQSEGLSVHELKVFVIGENGHWGYRLVLYQGDFSNTAEGRYDFVFYGHTEGNPGQYRLSDLVEEGQQRSFSFRYFVTLGGKFRLPERFAVERIEVKVTPSDEKTETFQKTFSWRQAMANSG